MNEQQRAVVQRALDALEQWTTPRWAGTGVDKANAAAAALRQLLEQPEPVQEPDCWAILTPNGSRLVSPDEAKGRKYAYPLYTTPPAKPAVWAGLTDEDVYPLANEHLHYQTEGYEVSGVYNLARAIEAKLKEKNT